MSNIGHKTPIYGVGFNDADYIVARRETLIVGGRRVRKYIFRCPHYIAWSEMLRRACSAAFKIKEPSYVGVEVCEDWKRFSVFRAWMVAQDWEGKELDKDILSDGRKIYSPESCCFVSRATNLFTTNCFGSLAGSNFDRGSQKYKSQISTSSGRKTLGYFDTPEEAHFAWCAAKIEECHRLIASENLSGRIGSALLARLEDIRARAKKAMENKLNEVGS